MEHSIVNRDPDILGGTPVFIGTRVPIKAIFDYLEAGDSLEEFLDDPLKQLTPGDSGIS